MNPQTHVRQPQPVRNFAALNTDRIEKLARPKAVELPHKAARPPQASSSRSIKSVRSAHCTPAQVCELMNIAACPMRADGAERFTTRRVRRGERLITAGQSMANLYVIRAGFFKSVLLSASGEEHVLGFPMRGDLLGSDGLATGKHNSEMVALSDGEVVVLPVADLDDPERALNLPRGTIYRTLASELVRVEEMVSVRALGSAEARLAAFLIKIGRWMADRGFSSNAFNLHMTRQDIGSFLGLQLETVSRAFSALAHKGMIEVNRRAINILDMNQVRALSGA